jgi:hypothetical protein
MILDMIQGCRYLRRSTDRWTLSKNTTTWLKDSRVWRKAGLLWEYFEYNYIQPGFIFIPCRSMTPGGLRVQYLIPNLSPKREWLSIHSSIPLGPRHHAIPQNQRKQSLCRTEANCGPQAPLPNLLKKPSFSRTDFSTKLGPQIKILPVPNFGVNICPLQLQDKSDFIPKLTPIANVFKLNLFNTYFLSSQSIRASVQIQTLGHLSPKLESSMAGQNQAAQVNFISVSFIRHYLFDFYLRFLPPPFRNRSFPLSFWFALRSIRHLISLALWELPIPTSSLQPNPRESLSKRLYLGLLCGKTPSKASLCPQLQAGGTGI